MCRVHTTVRKKCKTLLCIAACSFFSCVNVSDRGGRINPFDTNGDNWFPPRIRILEKDTIEVAVSDTFAIQFMVGDDNGRATAVKWLCNAVLVTIDSLQSPLDTMVQYDTLIDTVFTADSTRLYDSSFVDSVTRQPTVISRQDSTIMIYCVDSANALYDTLSYNNGAFDTSWSYEMLNFFLYRIIRYTWRDTVVYDTIFTPAIGISDTNYLYASRFAIDTVGVYLFTVSAYDDDSVASLIDDSVIVVVEDSLAALP